jgi:hypothetical protein
MYPADKNHSCLQTRMIRNTMHAVADPDISRVKAARLTQASHSHAG